MVFASIYLEKIPENKTAPPSKKAHTCLGDI